MLTALRQLGCGVNVHGTTVTITGLGGQLKHHDAIEFFMGNAGTAMRPLTAALAVLGGDFTLKGVPRMHERPIGDLVDALRLLGCNIDYLGNDGFPPLHKTMSNKQWQQVFQAAYADFCERTDAADATKQHDGGAALSMLPMDPYAGESPAEFFAVVSEAFFELPQEIKRAYPEVYSQLTLFFRQDPAARQNGYF
jgi:hypothetical protein